jgi:phosphatidylinositol N-acetylglucosaminyltransferase subunit A
MVTSFLYAELTLEHNILLRLQDVVRAMSEAIHIVSQGKHDPIRAHERVKTFYDWGQVAERTETVYEAVLNSPQMDLWERMQR